MALAVDMMNVDSAPSAARRRRERRLRQFLRHERLTVAMVLSEKKHHTSRGQNKDRTTGEENVMNYTAKLRKTPPPAAAATVYDPMVLDEGGALAAGGLPAPLSEVAGRQLRVERHCGVGFELVLALDVPVLQMVEQPVEVDTFFRLSLPAVVEQVIDVPKLALPGCAVQRAALSEPQTVEQLVEVPTVLSYSLLQQRTAEQTMGIAVPRRGGGARGGLQGFSQGQGSTAVCGADLPTSFLQFLTVVEEVLVEVVKASPRDRAHQRFLVQITSTLLFFTFVEEVLGKVFKASPKDRAQQRFVEQNMLTLLFTVVEEVLGEVF